MRMLSASIRSMCRLFMLNFKNHVFVNSIAPISPLEQKPTNIANFFTFQTSEILQHGRARWIAGGRRRGEVGKEGGWMEEDPKWARVLDLSPRIIGFTYNCNDICTNTYVNGLFFRQGESNSGPVAAIGKFCALNVAFIQC